ncbi:MAG: cupin domain-containing protein [Longimicrobiales bacterium]
MTPSAFRDEPLPAPRNLEAELDAVDEHWFPRIVARVNDHYLKVAKVEGALTWHAHDGQDELFLVLKGRLTLQIEGRDDIVLEPGDVFVVPAGVRHHPVAEEECWIALVEPVDTDHTGGQPSGKHRSIEDQLGA